MQYLPTVEVLSRCERVAAYARADAQWRASTAALDHAELVTIRDAIRATHPHARYLGSCVSAYGIREGYDIDSISDGKGNELRYSNWDPALRDALQHPALTGYGDITRGLRPDWARNFDRFYDLDHLDGNAA